MSLLSRLKDNFRVQSNAVQIQILAIIVFVFSFLDLPLFSALFGTLIVVAITWLIAFLIIKIFDRNGDYSLHTIWKTLLVFYVVYLIVSWIL